MNKPGFYTPIDLLFSANTCFVAYCLPNKNIDEAIVSEMTATVLESLDNLPKTPGFLFSPFNTQKHLIYWLSDIQNDQKILDKIQSDTESTKKTSFIENIDNIKRLISENKIEKLVLSKVVSSELSGEFLLSEIFKDICLKYLHAFRFIVQIPGIGTWIGATPEPLCVINENRFRTVSLAATKIAIDEKPSLWNDKEKKEQAIVSDFISENLQKLNLKDIRISGPETVVAGNLFHLQTSFECLIGDTSIGEIISSLHPTPSVCGFPREKSFELIQSFENHDREYYTGILGPVNIFNNTQLFVNLRSVKINSGRIIYYAGAGITLDSDPQNEWDETEFKIETIRSVCRKFENH